MLGLIWLFYLVWCSFTKAAESLDRPDAESEWWVISHINTFMTGLWENIQHLIFLLEVSYHRGQGAPNNNTLKRQSFPGESLYLSILPLWTLSINLSLAFVLIYFVLNYIMMDWVLLGFSLSIIGILELLSFKTLCVLF